MKLIKIFKDRAKKRAEVNPDPKGNEGAQPSGKGIITPSVLATPNTISAPETENKEPRIVLSNIVKDYYIDKKPYRALNGITLAFPKKGFIAILGPSGCGKTTLLNIIGGLDHYTSGDLLINGKSTKDFTNKEWDGYRNEQVGFVFQTYNLIQHMNIISNVEISLMLNGKSRSERSKIALAALENVGLKDEAKKRPNQLSGGQMQRVALARALVNDPSIVLADEPTGALDSVTSVQVMDLLKEVANDRLVVMVTHNKELAKKYATRIIEMKDGVILKDSEPLDASGVTATGKQQTKKTSMSFLTAIKSSLTNINTKKTRTILTAVASSFGIIGVALVLAVNNGFTNYISSVEGSIASSVPITISPMTYTMITNNTATGEKYPTDNQVHVYDSTTSYYTTHRNNYDQNYFDTVLEPMRTEKKWVKNIIYNREGLDFHLMTTDGMPKNTLTPKDAAGDPIYKIVNQYDSGGMMSSAISSFTGLPTSVFHELYAFDDTSSSQYSVIFGRAPKAKDEVVLITDRYNQIDLSTLKSLGILPSAQSSVGEDEKISFDDIIWSGDTDTAYKEYEVFKNSDFYRTGLAGSRQEFTDTAWKVKGLSLVQTTGSDGTTSLSIKLNKEATTKTLVSYERPITPDKNSSDVATRNPYKAIYSDSSYNPLKLKVVGVLRPSESSYISLMSASIGYLPSLKEYLAEDNQTQGGKLLTNAAAHNWYVYRDPDVSDYSTSTWDCANLLEKNIATVYKALTTESASDYLANTTDIKAIANSLRYAMIDRPSGQNKPNRFYNNTYYLSNNYLVGSDFNETKTSSWINAVNKLSSNKKMAELESLMNEQGFFDPDSVSSEGFNLMDLIAYYQSYNLITSVLIMPASLTYKQPIKDTLDAYNNSKTDEEDKIIASDIMSTFTDSLGTMVRVISSVLIVFASISLVVSSVMTGIITYVSVIERTKEIGILRACGARRVDVSRLFEAECSIIGFAAGVIGILITLLLCFPVNQILNGIYPEANIGNIASLNPIHALILLAVSVVLAMVSGLIPAIMAANKDPVEALRTE